MVIFIAHFDGEIGISCTIHAVIPVGMRASFLDSQTGKPSPIQLLHSCAQQNTKTKYKNKTKERQPGLRGNVTTCGMVTLNLTCGMVVKLPPVSRQ